METGTGFLGAIEDLAFRDTITLLTSKTLTLSEKLMNKTCYGSSAGCTFLRAEGFSCRSDVFYEDLGISKLLFDQKKIIKKRFQQYFFFSFW